MVNPQLDSRPCCIRCSVNPVHSKTDMFCISEFVRPDAPGGRPLVHSSAGVPMYAEEVDSVFGGGAPLNKAARVCWGLALLCVLATLAAVWIRAPLNIQATRIDKTMEPTEQRHRGRCASTSISPWISSTRSSADRMRFPRRDGASTRGCRATTQRRWTVWNTASGWAAWWKWRGRMAMSGSTGTGRIDRTRVPLKKKTHPKVRIGARARAKRRAKDQCITTGFCASPTYPSSVSSTSSWVGVSRCQARICCWNISAHEPSR